MEKFNLAEKCMAITGNGERCKNGGPQRHADAHGRYAICKQHADMLLGGREILFATKITPEEVVTHINQVRLPGLDDNVQIAREALNNSNKENNMITAQVFYVRGLVKGSKVQVLHETTVQVEAWSRNLILVEAIKVMPNVEGQVTGILARSGDQKLAFNRKGQTWVPRPVPAGLVLVRK